MGEKMIKLERLKRHRASCISDHETALTGWNEMIAQVEAKLAEPEKPELRHGDYGEGPAGSWIRVHGSTWWGIKDCSGPSEQDADVFIPYRLGNIFADLEALSEDVEEVGRDDLKNKAAHNAFEFKIVRGSIHYHGDEHACFSYAEFAELVLKLRQMAATAARKSGKQD